MLGATGGLRAGTDHVNVLTGKSSPVQGWMWGPGGRRRHCKTVLSLSEGPGLGPSVRPIQGARSMFWA